MKVTEFHSHARIETDKLDMELNEILFGIEA